MDASALHASRLARAVDYARREPGKVLGAVLALHLVVWTALPALLSRNLQLDLAEGLALGKEWQLVYWKHPPLPWWVTDAVYRVVGDVHAVYLLGPLAAVVCLYAVWLLGRETVGAFPALIAVLALEGLHFFNFSVVKFAHDQMQLPFWALTGLFFHRALTRRRLLDWALAGAFLAAAFWSKYAAFALAATCGLFLLLDPVARRAWRTAGPYVMAAAFALTIAPNLWALAAGGFMPFRYADNRARVAANWYQYLSFPLEWTAGQMFFLLPVIALMVILYARSGARARAAPGRPDAFDRRYLAALALGPFAVTTLVAAMLGRLPVAMWGYPLWSFAPLAAIAWLGVSEERRLRWFAAAFAAVFLAMPLAYAVVEAGEPILRDRPKATQFPGRVMADALTRAWREKTGAPLVYVVGTEFAANTTAVYSPDRPHVIPHGELKFAPWVDRDDVRRRGVLLVWEEYGEALVPGWRQSFPGAEIEPPLLLPRQTLRAVRPVRIGYAIVPPRP
jgi:4-amino-4-deoxy-L-arabinose transferase-like glycosyltransferase